MIGKEAEETGYATIEEVYEILKGRKASDMKYEQQITLEYAEKFKINKKKYSKISTMLDGVDGLTDSMKAKILEVLPKSEILLKQVLAAERLTIPDDKRDELLKLTNESV